MGATSATISPAFPDQFSLWTKLQEVTTLSLRFIPNRQCSVGVVVVRAGPLPKNARVDTGMKGAVWARVEGLGGNDITQQPKPNK